MWLPGKNPIPGSASLSTDRHDLVIVFVLTEVLRSVRDFHEQPRGPCTTGGEGPVRPGVSGSEHSPAGLRPSLRRQGTIAALGGWPGLALVFAMLWPFPVSAEEPRASSSPGLTQPQAPLGLFWA